MIIISKIFILLFVNEIKFNQKINNNLKFIIYLNYLNILNNGPLGYAMSFFQFI